MIFRPATRGLLLAGLCLSAEAAEPIGPMFPIAEPDALEELQRAAGSADWSAIQRTSIENAPAAQSLALPVAKIARSFFHDPTYHLLKDIIDSSGRLLYPAGTPVNVYDRLKIPGRFIVVPDTENGWNWLETIAKPTPSDVLLMSGGNIVRQRRDKQMPLYLLDERWVERLGLQAAPAIVSQVGNQLRIDEYALD